MKNHIILLLVPILAMLFSTLGYIINSWMEDNSMPTVSEGQLDSSYRLLTKFSICWYLLLAALYCAGWL